MCKNTQLLVIDDEEIICRACQRILTPHGFLVHATTDAVKGLCWANENEYAGVLLDIRMATLNGIRLLEKLRKSKPRLPVILITGHPNVEDAASAVRLHAADYVTKPFTPERIVTTVQRAVRNGLTGKRGGTHNGSCFARPWIPRDDLYWYFNRSWLQRGRDGSARFGLMLARRQPGLRVTQLPRIGETVYQGLPAAALTTKTGTDISIAAPLSGVVVAVNERLAHSPSLLLEEPLTEGWVACISPTRWSDELVRCHPRRVILVNSDVSSARRQVSQLARLGCQVSRVPNVRQACAVAGEACDPVAMIDAASFGERGPQLVRQLNEALPNMRVIVVASPESTRESAYRTQRIFYYAVRPFDDDEIVEILDAAFRPRPARATNSSALPSRQPRQKICIQNANGKRVHLLASQGLLWQNSRLGAAIANELRDHVSHIEIDDGEPTELTPTTVLHAASACDRLLVLLAKDTKRLPGTLSRSDYAECSSALREDSACVTTMIVQPRPDKDAPFAFDEDTTAALGGHIAQEMILS